MTLATKFAIRRRDDGARFFDNSAGPYPRGPRRLAEAARRRPHRPLLCASRRQIDSDRGHGRANWRASSKRARSARSDYPRSRPTRSDALTTCTRSPPSSRNIRYGRAIPNLASIQACAELGAILVAFSPLGRGYLSGLLAERRDFRRQGFPPRSNPRFQGLNWRRNRDRLDAFCRSCQIMGTEACDAGHRLDARQGAARRADSRHPRRRPSRGMRRGGGDRSDRRPDSRRSSALCRSASPPASAIPSSNGWGSRSTEGGRSSACSQRNASGPFSEDTPNRARMPSSRRRVGAPSTSVAR